MDLHEEFDRYGHAHGDAAGSRLREGGVRAALEARVTRGRRIQNTKWGVGTVAAVGALAVGAVMVPRLGDQQAPGSPRSTAPASTYASPTDYSDLPTTYLTDLPTTSLRDFFSVFGLHGPEDGIVDEPSKISQEIPEQFACGAPWTLARGYYYNQGAAGMFAEFTDGVTPNATVLDAGASDVNFISQVSTGLGMYYDTFVLAWVKDGVIVGNARVSRADGPLIEGTAGERLSTVRGATAVGADSVQLPLAGPGVCEAGAAPTGLADGSYELHVIHEYGSAGAGVDGHQYSDPSVQIAQPTANQLVEFMSADPFGAVVDPTGGPWAIEVVGLVGSATATAEPQVATDAPSLRTVP